MTLNNDDAQMTVHFTAELEEITQRLSREFASSLDPATVSEFVQASYSTFAAKAKVPTFLPLLTERFTRQRLEALSKVEGGGTGTPTVLFLCVHNAGRSQMALGFLHHHGAGRVIGWSGGSAPGDRVNPGAVAAMAEKGIDISGEYPKPWTAEIVRAADVVITMGCGDTCPYYPGKRYEDWVLDDPAGQGIEPIRAIRDEIESRVLSLLASLDVDAHEVPPESATPQP